MAAGTTYVSDPGAPTGPSGPGVAAAPGAPGAAGPGAQMSPAAAVGWLIVGAAAIGVTTAYLGRKGARPQLGHLDVFDAVYNAATVAVIFGTAKVLAYRYHGHRVSQAVLLVL